MNRRGFFSMLCGTTLVPFVKLAGHESKLVGVPWSQYLKGLLRGDMWRDVASEELPSLGSVRRSKPIPATFSFHPDGRTFIVFDDGTARGWIDDDGSVCGSKLVIGVRNDMGKEFAGMQAKFKKLGWLRNERLNTNQRSQTKTETLGR